MKSHSVPFRISLAVFLSIMLLGVCHSQTQLPLPIHSSTFSGNARGYWFIAPMAFTITGLMVAPEAGAGLQYIHLMKTHDPMPINFSTPSANFTTLTYISAAPNNTVSPVNIPIQQGDTLVIMGTAGTINSYSASGVHTSTIGSHTVTMGRAGTQNSIVSGAAPNYWGYDPLVAYQLGRIFIYYQLASPTDAGLQTFVFPADTICEGNSDVVVRVKNHGPNTLHSVDIEWEVNSSPQPPFSWSGTMAVNDSDDVTIGSYQFLHAVSYSITSYTSTPNYAADTINNLNDTIHKSGIHIRPAPAFAVYDTILNICQGDTAFITGTLSGTPPWDMIISHGTTSTAINNITNPAVSIPFTPTSSAAYTISAVTDATGCENTNTQHVTVSVQAAPPAAISTPGGTAKCMGDSLSLMASIGMNFSYQWYKDGVVLPGDTNFVLNVKSGGDYSVLVISPIGCSTMSDPVTVVFHPLPNVFIGNDTALLPVQSIMLDAGAGFNSYSWSTGENTRSIIIDSAGIGIGVKTVWVHVTDNFYCLGGDTIKINFTDNIGINEALSNSNIQIYPNPSGGKFELNLSKLPAGTYNIEVYNIDGGLSWNLANQLNNKNISLDLSHLANGVYVLKIIGRAGTISERIIRE